MSLKRTRSCLGGSPRLKRLGVSSLNPVNSFCMGTRRHASFCMSITELSIEVVEVSSGVPQVEWFLILFFLSTAGIRADRWWNVRLHRHIHYCVRIHSLYGSLESVAG